MCEKKLLKRQRDIFFRRINYWGTKSASQIKPNPGGPYIFNLLNSDSSTSNIISQRPLFSFKKDRNLNLHTFLVKGILPSNKEIGTFRCSRKRFLSCSPFVVSRTTVTGPKSTLNITDL